MPLRIGRFKVEFGLPLYRDVAPDTLHRLADPIGVQQWGFDKFIQPAFVLCGWQVPFFKARGPAIGDRDLVTLARIRRLGGVAQIGIGVANDF